MQPLHSQMLFCKYLEKSRSRERARILKPMADKSTSTEPTAVAQPSAIAEGPVRKVYPIVKYGDPVLEKPGVTIQIFDAELERLAEDMFASMYAAQGVGLAAPQIGKSIQLTVIDVSNGKNPEAKIVLVNPEIIHAEGEVSEEEGCLSVPGFRGYVGSAPICYPKSAKSERRAFSDSGEKSPRARFLLRNRSFARNPVFATPEHAEARPDQEKD